jgi:hypothetical protein
MNDLHISSDEGQDRIAIVLDCLFNVIFVSCLVLGSPPSVILSHAYRIGGHWC